MLSSDDSSILTPRAFGSLAQHSGGLVFICLGVLLPVSTGGLYTNEPICTPLAKAQEITTQVLPRTGSLPQIWRPSEFNRQRTTTGASEVFSELFFVRGKNTDATSAPRNCFYDFTRSIYSSSILQIKPPFTPVPQLVSHDVQKPLTNTLGYIYTPLR